MMRTTYVGTYVGYLYLRRLRRAYEPITYGTPRSVTAPLTSTGRRKALAGQGGEVDSAGKVGEAGPADSRTRRRAPRLGNKQQPGRQVKQKRGPPHRTHREIQHEGRRRADTRCRPNQAMGWSPPRRRVSRPADSRVREQAQALRRPQEQPTARRQEDEAPRRRRSAKRSKAGEEEAEATAGAGTGGRPRASASPGASRCGHPPPAPVSHPARRSGR
eukprot:scaffold24268_cov99-Isochrysis_galbana.AAC.2